MENTSFEKLYYDYYANTSSYVKKIVDLIPNDREYEDKKSAIQVIYNYLLNTAHQPERENISRLSYLFNEKMEYLPQEEVLKRTKYYFDTFFNSMIHDSINREKIFNILNDCIEVYVRYYPSYQGVTINFETNSFDYILYDYYESKDSFVKTVMEMLPADTVSEKTRLLIKRAFNYVMNNLDATKREEIAFVSSMFIEKLDFLSQEEINEHIDFIYNDFLKRMIDDFSNCDKIFDVMIEAVKVISGYYSAYRNIIVKGENDIVEERGSYR